MSDFETEEEIVELRYEQKIADILRQKLSTDDELFVRFLKEIRKDAIKAEDNICSNPDPVAREQSRVELIALRYVEKTIHKFITIGDNAHDRLLSENIQDQENEDG